MHVTSNEHSLFSPDFGETDTISVETEEKHPLRSASLPDHLVSVSQSSKTNVAGSGEGMPHRTIYRWPRVADLSFFDKGTQSVHDVELQQILTQGGALKSKAEAFSDAMSARNGSLTSLPIRLTGTMGLVLGGVVGFYAARSVWQAWTGRSDEPEVDEKRRIHRDSLPAREDSAMEQSASFAPEHLPMPAALEGSPEKPNERNQGNHIVFINVNNMEYDVLINRLISPKSVFDVMISIPDKKYYDDYIRVIFEEVVHNATKISSNGRIEEGAFINSLKKHFRYILDSLEKMKLTGSPGLCDLKQRCFSIFKILNDPIVDGSLPGQGSVARDLNSEAFDALDVFEAEKLRHELRSALICLMRESCDPAISARAEIIVGHARRVFSEISSLKNSGSLQAIVIKNVARRLNKMDKDFHRGIDAPEFSRKLNYRSICASLKGRDDFSSNKDISYISCLIACGTIIPDLVGLSENGLYNLTDPSVLNDVLLDLKKEKTEAARKFVSTNTLAILPVPEKRSMWQAQVSSSLDTWVDGDSRFVSEKRLGYDDVTNEEFTPKLVVDMVKLTMDRNFYNRYFHIVLRNAISGTEAENSNEKIGVENFISVLKVKVDYILKKLNNKNMLRSPGLCDLQSHCLNVLKFLYPKTSLTPIDTHYHDLNFQPESGTGSLTDMSAAVREILGAGGIERIAEEIRSVLVCLSKKDCKSRLSRETRIILRNAGSIFSESFTLSRSHVLQKLIFENVSINLFNIYSKVSGEIGHSGFLRDLSAFEISGLLASLNEPETDFGKTLISLSMAHALIIPDLIDLCEGIGATRVHPVILKNILKDIAPDNRIFGVEASFNGSFIASCVEDREKTMQPEFSEATLESDPGNMTIPFSSLNRTTTADQDAEAALKDVLGVDDAVDLVDDGIDTDIGAATGIVIGGGVGVGIGAGAAMASGSAGASGTGAAAAANSAGVAGREGVDVRPAIHETSRVAAAESRDPGEFVYPAISHALDRRASSIAKDSEEERKSYVYDEISKVYRATEYIIARGLTVQSDDPANIVESKIMAKSHIEYTRENLSKMRSMFEQIERQSAMGVVFKNHIIEYFSRLFNSMDDSLIYSVLSRLKEVAVRTEKYLEKLTEGNFEDLWFVTSKGDVARQGDGNEFFTLLSADHLNEMPFAATYSSDKSIMVIYAEKSQMTNIEHPVAYRRYQTHHLGETFFHECTHFSSCTQDYMYFTRTSTGRAKSAADMMKEFHANLKAGRIGEDLRHLINNYCRIYGKAVPKDFYSFFESELKLKSYVIMNNAPSYEVFFRDIVELKKFDAIPPR